MEKTLIQGGVLFAVAERPDHDGAFEQTGYTISPAYVGVFYEAPDGQLFITELGLARLREYFGRL